MLLFPTSPMVATALPERFPLGYRPGYRVSTRCPTCPSYETFASFATYATGPAASSGCAGIASPSRHATIRGPCAVSATFVCAGPS